MNDNDLIRNRLIAYIDRRKQAGGIDYEHIHSFDIGSSTQVDLLTSDIEALTLERAAGPYLRTGVFDRDGREICVGDKIRIDLTSNHTKPEYWKPKYEVVFQPPHFTLKHIGGDKDSDTARFRFNVPQPRSTASIETIRTATAPEPAEVTAAQLADPKAVHANMLRGTIAKPTVAQIIHIYGRDPILHELAMRGAVHEPAHVTAVRVVKIKPLVWEQSAGGVWIAQTGLGSHYSVADSQWFYGPMMAWVWVEGGDDAAKAAAQADYEARIRSAIAEARHD